MNRSRVDPLFRALRRLGIDELPQIFWRPARSSASTPGSFFISDDAVARRILLHLGLDSRGPTVARAQAPPDFGELGPSYDGADPAYAD